MQAINWYARIQEDLVALHSSFSGHSSFAREFGVWDRVEVGGGEHAVDTLPTQTNNAQMSKFGYSFVPQWGITGVVMHSTKQECTITHD